jgi:hydroxypyruvate isomerase
VPRFAANLTMMFSEVPFLDRFAAAAGAGFDAVEFLFPYDYPAAELAARAKDAGLRIVLFNMPPGDWAAGERGTAIYPARAAEFSAGLAKALDYAAMLGVPRLHMMAGIGDAHDANTRSRYLDALGEAADAGAARGLDLLIEPLNKRDMPGYFLNDFALAAELIAATGRPNIKLQFDIYHRQILHGDVIRGLEKLLPITGHIQTASVPQRAEPGSGELDDRRIFATLDRLGYAGHVGCEYRPAAGTIEGLGWMTIAAGNDMVGSPSLARSPSQA